MRIQLHRRYLGALIVPAACLLVSCAMTSFKSHIVDETPRRQYSDILIISMLDNLKLQTAMETKATEFLADYGLKGEPACSLFVPDWIYARHEFDSVVTASGADAILYITPVTFSSGSTWPATNTLGGIAAALQPSTQESALPGDQLNPAGTFVYTTSLPREYPKHGFLPSESMTFKAALGDVSSRGTVWWATEDSEGDALVGYGSLAKSMGGRTILILKKDGMLK